MGISIDFGKEAMCMPYVGSSLAFLPAGGELLLDSPPERLKKFELCITVSTK